MGGIVKQVANTGIASLLRRFPGAGGRRAFLESRQDGHVPGGHFEAVSHRAVFADALDLGGDLGIGLGQFRQVLDDDGIHRVALIGFYLERHQFCLGVDTLICGNLLVRRNLVGGHGDKLAALIYIVGLAVFKGGFQTQLKGIGRGGGGNGTVFGGLGGNAVVLAADGLLDAQESAKGRGAEEILGLAFHHIHHHAQQVFHTGSGTGHGIGLRRVFPVCVAGSDGIGRTPERCGGQDVHIAPGLDGGLVLDLGGAILHSRIHSHEAAGVAAHVALGGGGGNIGRGVRNQVHIPGGFQLGGSAYGHTAFIHAHCHCKGYRKLAGGSGGIDVHLGICLGGNVAAGG